MTIRWKPMVIIGTVLASLILLLLLISRIILMDGFIRLEEESTRENVQRVLDALRKNITHISRITGDYAFWDDSYAFVAHPSDGYIRNNLVDTTFTGLKLNLIAFVDTTGRVVYSRAFNLETGQPEEPPPLFRNSLPPSHQLLRHDGKPAGTEGVTILSRSPVLVVSRPILPSDKKGAPRGTLIMGRRLDAAMIADLARITHVKIDIRRLDGDSLPADFESARPLLSGLTSILAKPLTEDTVAGYSLIPDLSGAPILQLRVTTPRNIYRQGMATSGYFMAWTLAIALSCGIVIYFLLDKYLTARTGRSEEQERYRTVVAQASDGIILFDGRTKHIIDSNNAFRRMIGRGNGCELNLYDVFGDVRSDIEAMVGRALREKKPVTGELHFHRDGAPPAEVLINMNRLTLEKEDLLCAVVHDITERKRSEKHLTKLNECFIGFTTDPVENIKSLTALSGELMGADCALYNRLMDGMLHTLAQWHAPDDFNPTDRPEGHICHDVIEQGGNSLFIVRNLPGTPYALTDPNVTRYNLQTYIGMPVRCGGSTVASLCVVYRKDYSPTEEDRKLLGILAVAVETAEENRRAAEILKESERFAHSTLNALPECIAIIDENGSILAVNRQWRNHARDSATVMQRLLEGENYLEACDSATGSEAEQTAAFSAGIRAVIRGTRESFSLEYPCHTAQEQNWYLGRANRFHGDGPIRVVIVHEDITDLKKAEKNIQRLAYYDILTELPNRLLLNDRLTQAITSAMRFQRMLAVMFLDLDHFKIINDTLGHSAGDRLLKEVAVRLTQHIRACDTVARMGGDEFVIVLGQIKATEDVSRIAQMILDTLAHPFKLGTHEFFITTSIGIAMFPDDGSDRDRLLKNADAAMYQAKERGRNTYQFFSNDLNIMAEERLERESHLRHALEREELLIEYQPWLDLASGRVAGFEALLRWNDRKLGIVPPEHFIRLAEDTGLIIPIGEWVLHAVCDQIRALRDAGYPSLRVAVNLSGRQIKNYNLADVIGGELSKSGINPACLELKITESSLMENIEEATRLLRTIKQMGMGLSVDDFGTGHTSLHYLKSFPIDKLKINRSFVSGIPDSSADMAITHAIIAMARSLRLRVIAEGVETGEQVAFLSAHGCDEIQGYFVSPPLPGSKLTEFLQRYSHHLPAPGGHAGSPCNQKQCPGDAPLCSRALPHEH